jgi:hypothetical protein
MKQEGADKKQSEQSERTNGRADGRLGGRRTAGKGRISQATDAQTEERARGREGRGEKLSVGGPHLSDVLLESGSMVGVCDSSQRFSPFAQ